MLGQQASPEIRFSLSKLSISSWEGAFNGLMPSARLPYIVVLCMAMLSLKLLRIQDTPCTYMHIQCSTESTLLRCIALNPCTWALISVILVQVLQGVAGCRCRSRGAQFWGGGALWQCEFGVHGIEAPLHNPTPKTSNCWCLGSPPRSPDSQWVQSLKSKLQTSRKYVFPWSFQFACLLIFFTVYD